MNHLVQDGFPLMGTELEKETYTGAEVIFNNNNNIIMRPFLKRKINCPQLRYDLVANDVR